MESRLHRLADEHDKLQHQAQAVLDANLDELTSEKAAEVDGMISAANRLADVIELAERVDKITAAVEEESEEDPIVSTETGGSDDWVARRLANSKQRPSFLASEEYFDAWCANTTHGRPLPEEFRAALTETDVAPAIPENWNRTILSTREISSKIRGRARVIDMDAIGKERLTLHTADPTVDTVTAGAAIGESKPTYEAVVLDPNKYGVWIPVNMEAWDDAFGIQSNLPFSTGRAMGNKEERWMFVDGDGSTQPQSITGNVGTAFETASADVIVYADLINFLHGGFVGDDYIEGPNSAWFMSVGMMGNIRNIKDTSNDPIFKQGSLRDGVPNQLLGSDVDYVKSLPGLDISAAVTGALFYGDLMYGYAVGDRLSPTMERFNEVLARTDQVGFKSVARVDGKVQHTEAIGQFDVKA